MECVVLSTPDSNLQAGRADSLAALYRFHRAGNTVAMTDVVERITGRRSHLIGTLRIIKHCSSDANYTVGSSFHHWSDTFRSARAKPIRQKR